MPLHYDETRDKKMKIASVLKSFNGMAETQQTLTHCAEGYVTGMNNVLWEVEEGVKNVAWGWGSVLVLLVCILFHHWKYEDNFTHTHLAR